MAYTIAVWFIPPHRRVGRQKNTGSINMVRLLKLVQGNTSCTITGALKGTVHDASDTHANLPPIQVTLKYICYRAAIQMCLLPKEHPNLTQINTLPSPKPKPNKSQITRLLQLFRLDTWNTEKISPSMLTLDAPLPFTI